MGSLPIICSVNTQVNNLQDNILVLDNGQPCLGDFGLSKVLMAEGIIATMTDGPVGSLRWMSPELIIESTLANEARMHGHLV